MFIRKKLILSNLAMLLVPIFLVVFISHMVLQTFILRYAVNYDFVNDNLPEKITTLVKLAGDDKEKEALFSHCRKFEDIGVYLKITDQNGSIYVSEKFETIFQKVQPPPIPQNTLEQVAYNGLQGSALYLAKAGANPIAFQLISEKILSRDFMMTNTTEIADAFTKRMLLVIIAITVLVIVFTNGVLTLVMSQSILVPLAVLREGTRQIREGNLDHTVHYRKKDEFGEVCADFEDMRLRLKQSVEEQENDQQSRKELITGITHDLRTPLTRIKGYTSGILDGIADTPEKRKDYLETIRATAVHMQKMVDDLFLFSKLDLNNVPFYFARTDVNQYLEQFCADRRQEFTEQEVDLIFHGADTPQYALIDQAQLNRVFANIMNNSARYKNEGRGRIEIFLVDRGDEIQISFKDNGKGVSSEEAGKIFEIFYRTDKARSETEKGSGVGLAIAKQIIEIHRGKIWALSERGSGLDIYISLPKDKGEAGA